MGIYTIVDICVLVVVILIACIWSLVRYVHAIMDICDRELED